MDEEKKEMKKRSERREGENERQLRYNKEI